LKIFISNSPARLLFAFL